MIQTKQIHRISMLQPIGHIIRKSNDKFGNKYLNVWVAVKLQSDHQFTHYGIFIERCLYQLKTIKAQMWIKPLFKHTKYFVDEIVKKKKNKVSFPPTPNIIYSDTTNIPFKCKSEGRILYSKTLCIHRRNCNRKYFSWILCDCWLKYLLSVSPRILFTINLFFRMLYGFMFNIPYTHS